MSTWSRMSSARFGKEEESTVGPGSYEIPTTMDEHAALIVPGERFQEQKDAPDSLSSSFHVFDEQPEKPKPQAQERRKSTRRALSAATAKENRLPASQSLIKGEKGQIQEPLEIEQLRRRLLEEEKRRAQAEARAADIAVAKKSAANAHAQLQSQERKLDQLQKELDDVSQARKEAQKRVCDLEAERGRGKKALHEKEQQALVLQKSLALAKAQLEERGKKLEELGGDAEKLRHEAQLLRHKLEDHEHVRSTATTPRRGTASISAKASPARSVAPCSEDSLNSLEQRFAEQTAQTEGQLRDLLEAQSRLHGKVESVAETFQELENAQERLDLQGEELERRRCQLYFVLEQSKEQEAHLEASVLVREATIVAISTMSDRMRASLEEAEARVKDLESQLQAECAAHASVAERLQELETSAAQQAAQHQEVATRLATEVAEVRGRLFTAEQAQLASQTAREALQRELSGVAEQAQAREAELSAEAERLQAELYETLAMRAEAEEAVRVKAAELARLCQEKDALECRNECLLAEKQEADGAAELARKRASDLEAQATEVKSLRALAAEAESAKAQAHRHSEEVRELGKECEEQRRQNRELLQSMQAYQKDLQRLEAENRALRDLEEKRDAIYGEMMDRQAESASHTNHRQKIQHIKSIKEDNQLLRNELKKARQRIAQLEIASSGDVVSRVLASVGRTPTHGGCGGTPTGGSKGTPTNATLRRSSTSGTLPGTQAGRPPALRRASSQTAIGQAAESQNTPRTTEAPLTLDEALRRCALKERAFERLSDDYQHLCVLLERAASSTCEEGPAAFIRRLCNVDMADVNPRPSMQPTAQSAPEVPMQVAPSTPTKRQSAVDGLSDLGDQSEVPEVIESEFDLDTDADSHSATGSLQ
eukprot:TRINITY_DN23069_c0_g1_i1.p1 TRINITY_DN23069_c0_g1~~TRINITY_DN23069_c0_g1_i1.p1  ORF type:complete len:904 (-),score=282.95 TRINITY_DN23069_c0_g1_i1:45-2708(-)